MQKGSSLPRVEAEGEKEERTPAQVLNLFLSPHLSPRKPVLLLVE